MPTEKDLINAVRDSLEADGGLGRMKAEMRCEVMKLMEGSTTSKKMTKRPHSPHDILVLNELIREYLDWIGYKYTLSVLTSECELGTQPLDRTFLAQDLKIEEKEMTTNLPLLFCLIKTFRSLRGDT